MDEIESDAAGECQTARRPWQKPLLLSASIKEMTAGQPNSGTEISGMFMASDARLKKTIVRVGTSARGIPIHEFNYFWGGPRYRGVIAQHLFDIVPEAVRLDACGYQRVDYTKIDVEFEVVSA